MTFCAAPCFSPRASSGTQPPQKSCATRRQGVGVVLGSCKSVWQWGHERETTSVFVSQLGALNKKKAPQKV